MNDIVDLVLLQKRTHHPTCHAEFISASAVDDEPRMLDPETSSG
jgi:hypothetical protein